MIAVRKKIRSFAYEINEEVNNLSDTCIMSDTNGGLLGTFLSDKHFKKSYGAFPDCII